MQIAVLLLCDISRTIANLRQEIDSYKKLPSHITLAYLKPDYNEDDVNNILSKIRRFDIRLNDISCDKDHIALYPNSKSNDTLVSIAAKIGKYVERKPTNGYHLSIAYSKKKWGVYEAEELCRQVTDKIDMPIDVRIKEIMIIKKNTDKTSGWFKINTIKLMSERQQPADKKIVVQTPKKPAAVVNKPKTTNKTKKT